MKRARLRIAIGFVATVFGAGCVASGNGLEGTPVGTVRQSASVAPPSLLLTNTVPQDPMDATYMAQLNALKDAFRTGRQVRVSMTYTPDGSEYFTELTAGRFRPDRINVVLPLQSYMNNHNVVSRLNGLFSECIDTLGGYFWGTYLFGSDNTALSPGSARTAFQPASDSHYIFKWYQDQLVPEMLLHNVVGQSATDPTYLAGLANLKQAFRDGRRVRVYMKIPAAYTPDNLVDEYFTQIISGRMEDDRVYAMLPLRPNLTAEALLSNTNAIFAGSIDSLGNYYFGAYEFNSGLTTTNSLDPSLLPNPYSNFEITWYAD